MFQKKKKKNNCDLLPLGSLFLSIFPFSDRLWKERKGGAMSVGSRLTGELVADPDLSGSSDPRSNGPVQFYFVMSSHKSLAAYPPTKR